MSSADRGPRLRLVREGERSSRPDALSSVAQAAAAGDRAAVRTFLLTVGPHLLRTVRRVLGAQSADADDVTQEAALAVMDALPRYRGEASVLHFVCRVAVLTAMNARRRAAAQKRRSVREDELGIEFLPSPAPGPEASASAEASAVVVRELLDTLPIEQAEVLALHCVLGCTLPEIAASAGLPLETVRSRLRLAKVALRSRVLGDPRLADDRSLESS
jgi:RNA polymerase sigma-70 factor, ECF subfamily